MHRISGISSRKLEPIKMGKSPGSLQKIVTLKGGYIGAKSLQPNANVNPLISALSIWLMGAVIVRALADGFGILLRPLKTKVIWLKEEVENDLRTLEQKLKRESDEIIKADLRQFIEEFDALLAAALNLLKSPAQHKYEELLKELEESAQNAGIQKQVTNRMAQCADHDAWPRITDKYRIALRDAKKDRINKKQIEKIRERNQIEENKKKIKKRLFYLIFYLD
jgi:hypothetical protein